MSRSRGSLSVLLILAAFVQIAALHSDPQFGVAEIGADGTGCLATNGQRLRVGDSLLVADAEEPVVWRARVEAELKKGCHAHQGVLGEAVLSYAIRLVPQRKLDATHHGVAVIAPNAKGSVRGGRPEIKIQGTKPPFTFRSCASHEGIHYTVWQGKRRVWHEYYYVPYDLEPDCTDEEV